MSVKIKEIADTAQNSISPILCPLVDLSPIHMTWMRVCYNSRLFGRNQLETVYGIFLTKTFKIDIIRSVVVSGHRKFSINFTQFHTNPIRPMLVQLNDSKTISKPFLTNKT